MRWPARIAVGVALTMAAGGGVRADDLKDGRVALQAGRFEEAMQAFERAASQGVAAGRAGVGQVWLRRHQFEKANEAFVIAQKMDATLALAVWGQGEVLRRQEKYEEAIPLFRRATELDRKFPEAQMGLGESLVRSRQYEAGVAALSEGLKWGPKVRPRFLVALGQAELARDSLRDAGIYFTKAAQEAPGDPEVRRALGEFYIKRGTWALAVLETQAAVDLDSTDFELRFSLAQALYYDERYDEALAQYKWIIARDPDFGPAHLAMGNLLYLAGAADPRRYLESREPLERYTKMQPEDPKGWGLLGRTLYYLKERDAALEALTRAEQLGDRTKDMFTVLGKLHAERREFAKAIAAFERGSPGPKEQLVIAQVYSFQNQPAKAESIYLGMIERDSTTSEARFAMNEIGKMRFRARDWSGALASFQRRISLDPNSAEAYYYIGLSQKELKLFPEALESLRRSVAIDSSKADRFFWVGVLSDQQKAVPEARLAFQRSVALDDSSKLAGKARRQLGYYLLLEKNWAEALGHLERAVALDDQDVQSWVWLGQGLQNSGDRERAVTAYRRALELDPNQPEAGKGLKVLSGGAAGTSKGGR